MDSAVIRVDALMVTDHEDVVSTFGCPEGTQPPVWYRLGGAGGVRTVSVWLGGTQPAPDAAPDRNLRDVLDVRAVTAAGRHRTER